MINNNENPVANIHFVTFPRSGHHLLERGMRAVLGSRFVYQGQTDPRYDYTSNWWVQAHKTHDYAGRFQPSLGGLVVVQTRDFEPAWESWKTYQEMRGEPVGPKSAWFEYWQSFMDRWVNGPRDDLILCVPYLALVRDPIGTVETVCRFAGVADIERTPAECAESVARGLAWSSHVFAPRESKERYGTLETMAGDYVRWIGATPELVCDPETEVQPGGGLIDMRPYIPETATEDAEADTELSQQRDPDSNPPAGTDPIEPSEPRQLNCDPSPVQTTSVRGLGMGTTAEL